jgi:hypothetical protein
MFSAVKNFFIGQPLEKKIHNALYAAVEKCNYDLAVKLFESYDSSIDVRHDDDRCVRLLIAKHLKDQDEKSPRSLTNADKLLQLLIFKGARPDWYELDFCGEVVGCNFKFHHAVMFNYCCCDNIKMVRWLFEKTVCDFSAIIPECIAACYMMENFALALYLCEKPHIWDERQSRSFSGSIFKRSAIDGNIWFVHKLVKRGLVVYFDFGPDDEKFARKFIESIKDNKRRRLLEASRDFNSRDHPEIFSYILSVNKK